MHSGLATPMSGLLRWKCSTPPVCDDVREESSCCGSGTFVAKLLLTVTGLASSDISDANTARTVAVVGNEIN